MGVDVGGDANVGVSEQFLDNDEADALLQESPRRRSPGGGLSAQRGLSRCTSVPVTSGNKGGRGVRLWRVRLPGPRRGGRPGGRSKPRGISRPRGSPAGGGRDWRGRPRSVPRSPGLRQFAHTSRSTVMVISSSVRCTSPVTRFVPGVMRSHSSQPRLSPSVRGRALFAHPARTPCPYTLHCARFPRNRRPAPPPRVRPRTAAAPVLRPRFAPNGRYAPMCPVARATNAPR